MKQIRIFTCPYVAQQGQFEQRGLQDFLKDKKILHVRSHFFTAEQTPCWTLVVEFETVLDPPSATPETPRSAREDWREQLSDSE